MKVLILLAAIFNAVDAAPQFLGGFSFPSSLPSSFPKLGGLNKGSSSVILGTPASSVSSASPASSDSPDPPPRSEPAETETAESGSIGGFGGGPGAPFATTLPDPSFFPAYVPVVPAPVTPACRNVPGDKGWPADNLWREALPGVVVVARKEKVEDNHPNYRYTAKNHGDVQAAVNFAAQHHLRLSIIATGHDFLGRNDAPTGLAISMHKVKGIQVSNDFKPTMSGVRELMATMDPVKSANVIKPIPGKQAYVTIGAGVTTQELNDALEPSGLMTMGAAHGSVSVAGGWGQAAGHGPLTSSYGLGVDQVVEYQVVTADGKLRIANAVSEPDLFWALRGGGGGTFGVVVQSTVKAYPSPKMTVASWWVNTTAAPQTASLYEAVAYVHSLLPNLNAKGVQGYYYVYPNAMHGIFLAAGNDAGQVKAKRSWAPVLAALSTMQDMGEPIQEYLDIGSYKEFYDRAFGPLDGMKNVTTTKGNDETTSTGLLKRGFLREANDRWHDVYRRHTPDADMLSTPADASMEKGPVPGGIIPMDSRLLDKAALTSPLLAKALQDSMPKLKNAMFRGHLVSGAKVHSIGASETSVNPAWRRAYVHLIGTGVGSPNIGPLKDLSKDSGAYVNECSYREKNWKYTLWGSNYDRLSKIKTQLDPLGLFYVTPGINADYFSLQNGRVCRTKPTDLSANTVPPSDSVAMGQNAESGNGLPESWPKDQAQADADAKKMQEKFDTTKKKGTSSAAAGSAKTSKDPKTSASSSIVTDAISSPSASVSSSTPAESSSKAASGASPASRATSLPSLSPTASSATTPGSSPETGHAPSTATSSSASSSSATSPASKKDLFGMNM